MTLVPQSCLYFIDSGKICKAEEGLDNQERSQSSKEYESVVGVEIQGFMLKFVVVALMQGQEKHCQNG